MLRFTQFRLLLVLLIGGLVSLAQAQVRFSGDISAVSTYVWRGVKQNNGPALQGTASATFKALTVGLWASSVDFGGPEEVETDPFVEIALPVPVVDLTVGAVAYSYDLLKRFNTTADLEGELYASLAYKALGLAVYYVPEQNSTKNNPNAADYWLELSGGLSKGGFDLSAQLAYGTYSARYLAKPQKEAVSLLLLSVSRPVNDQLSVNWNYSWGFHKNLEKLFWFGISYNL